MSEPTWLPWARRLQAVAQAGLTYARDPVEIARYTEVRAVAAEITARHSDLSVETLLGLFDQDSGYATPKVAARAVVFDGRRILLVRENERGWSMPGGYGDVNESPSEAVVRETLEESGYLVRPTRLLAVYDRSRHPHDSPRFRTFYTLFFDCDLVGKVQEASPLETDDAAFFPVDDLPPMRVPWMPEQIGRLFELHSDPHLPRDFD